MNIQSGNRSPLAFAKILFAHVLIIVISSPSAIAWQVSIPHTFQSDTAISSSDMNSNFDSLSTAVNGLDTSVNDLSRRLQALEDANAGRYYAGQSMTDAGTNVDNTWTNIPGISIPLVFSTPTKIRYQLFATVFNFAATVGAATKCSVRIVQDNNDTPLNPVFPTSVGDWVGILTGGENSPNNSEQVTLGGLVTLPAGSYNFKAQINRPAVPGNSGACSIFRWAFSRAQFFVDIVP